MNLSFLDNIYGSLFTPDNTFNELKEQPKVEQGVVIVAIVSILASLLNLGVINNFQNIMWLGFNILFSAFAGLISWVFFASFFELVATIFEKSGKMKVFLTLSAFALLPWIFTGPIELFKTAGHFGELIAILSGLFVWLWSTSLMIVAVIKTYDLSLGRALVFMTVPFVGGFLSFNWIVGFFATLSGILKV